MTANASIFVAALAVVLAVPPLSAADEALTDGEIWNRGVSQYEVGDVTNALATLRPLMLSRTHGARAAEVVAKLEHERGNREEAAVAAQIALRANPGDPRAARNFTRATDGLAEKREADRVSAVLKAAQGKDPAAMLRSATHDARKLMEEAGTYRTNAAQKAVALADSLSARAAKLADVWIPVRESIVQSVTNEEQAATVLQQLDTAREKTRKAAMELSDLDGGAYSTMSDVEHDFTRFMKLTVPPPAAMDEDHVCQSNAWMDVEAFNGRSWQQDALDFTRAFRAKFPAWAREYEQQAQADTNKPPFTAEAQAKVSALATELEKIQMECCEKNLPPSQEKALGIIDEIRSLLPKDGGGGGQGQSGQSGDKGGNDNQKNDQQQDPGEQKPEDDEGQKQEEEPQQQEPEKDEGGQPEEEKEEDSEVEAVLQKAQERNDEHEANKRARMRKAPLPPNERDW